MESAPCELALKPQLYNNNPIHTLNNSSRPGNTRPPRYYSLARGTHTFRTSGVSPGGNTHITRSSVSPEVNIHFGRRVSGASQ